MNAINVPISRIDSVEPGLYVTEASDLGLPPGVWPATIIVDDPDHDTSIHFDRIDTPRRGDDDRLGKHVDADGDLTAWDYGTRLGVYHLRVFND